MIVRKIQAAASDVAIDASRIMNPDRVRNQFEGSAVFGTSIAMTGEITTVDGRIEQSNFNHYSVARINDAPFVTHVHIVPSDALPLAQANRACRPSATRFSPPRVGGFVNCH
jgi:isoquinoline 1-oxidoreductase subunit beta